MRLPVFAVAAAALVLGAAVGTSVTRPASAQNQPVPPTAAVGRYQMSLSVHNDNTTSTTVFVLDTSTGQCWYRETIGGRPWTDHGSPASDAKK